MTSTGYVISMINAKGGVAKTSSVVNLGDALGKMGKKVLLVDFDPQGGLTGALSLSPSNLGKHMADVVLEDTPIVEIIRKAPYADVDIAPTNIDLSVVEFHIWESSLGDIQSGQITIPNVKERSLRILVKALAPIRDKYDYILIDNQPTLGLLSMNAITVADGIMIPVACEFMSLMGLQNVLKLIGLMTKKHNTSAQILGIVPTLFDTRNKHSRDVLSEISAACKARSLPLFRTIIPRSVRFQEAPINGQSILDYAPGSDLANSYINLALMVEKAVRKELAV